MAAAIGGRVALTGGFSLARDIAVGYKRITECNISLKHKDIEQPKIFDACCKDAKTGKCRRRRQGRPISTAVIALPFQIQAGRQAFRQRGSAASPAARAMTELPALAALKEKALQRVACA